MTTNEEQISENERELAAFANGKNTTISPVLIRILDEIKTTGIPYYEWTHLRALLVAQLQISIDQMRAAEKSTMKKATKPDDRSGNITALLSSFEGPPFTLQRLTEVLLEPTKSYQTLTKLFNALEKLLGVTSTMHISDPRRASVTAVQEDEEQPPTPLAVKVRAPGATSTGSPERTTEMDVVAKAPWATSTAAIGTTETSTIESL